MMQPLPYCHVMQDFVQGLDGIPDDAKEALKRLTPATYIGSAAEQARLIDERCSDIRWEDGQHGTYNQV